jgi:putative salt-induced outer membrane protein
MPCRILFPCALVAWALLLAGWSPAQPLPGGVREAKPASEGKTDVSKSGFEGAARPADEDKDTDTGELSAGGLMAAGNARQVALTASGKLRIRRARSQLSAAAAINYAEAAPDRDAELRTTVENLQSRARYDYFFAERWAAFLGVSARRDRFQGLDLRLNVDPGVAYYLIDREKHQLWLEGGYDFQYDVRRDENLDAARAEGQELEKTRIRHSVRSFAGYENQVNERVTFSTGIEHLQSVEALETWRLNWDASLKSNIAGRFSSAVVIVVKYDNDPLPQVEELDLAASFNLVYTLL